jgi:hypothetical protein
MMYHDLISLLVELRVKGGRSELDAWAVVVAGRKDWMWEKWFWREICFRYREKTL